ncbi:protein phosphatase 2C domain-containing protein [Streptacidiphilus rugosus]|uniref:protein phosphatase 2C domain-containing protein n=1 Tax=Streptacidiphilus rugosus TaxID=405783 RepID=UPI000565D65C|nr:protein phosphatase 2C domain-containing protein [Streptacidiphilus rugosus]
MRVEMAGEPQRVDRPNEDFVASSGDAFVMLDGCSSPTAMENGCEHGTAWFVRRLGVHLLARLTDRPDRTMAQCLSDAIAETASLHGARCDLAHPNTPAAMVVAARGHGPSLQYLVLGDSQLVLDRDGNYAVIGDNQPFPAGEGLRRQVYAAAHGSPERASLHMRYALAVRAARNTGHGPWVASALPRAAEFAETGSAPLAELRAFAALTDGAARFVDRFDLGGWPDAMRLMDQRGPAELVRRVREAEATDPACARWPRGKSRDDATALYARVR